MKFETFDRRTVQEVRKALNEALTDFVKEHELSSFKIGSITFEKDGSSLTTKLTLRSGRAVDKGEEDLKRAKELAPMYGLDPEVFGQSFTHEGETYTVIGLNTRARKQSVMLKIKGSTKAAKCGVKTLKSFMNL